LKFAGASFANVRHGSPAFILKSTAGINSSQWFASVRQGSSALLSRLLSNSSPSSREPERCDAHASSYAGNNTHKPQITNAYLDCAPGRVQSSPTASRPTSREGSGASVDAPAKAAQSGGVGCAASRDETHIVNARGYLLGLLGPLADLIGGAAAIISARVAAANLRETAAQSSESIGPSGRIGLGPRPASPSKPLRTEKMRSPSHSPST